EVNGNPLDLKYFKELLEEKSSTPFTFITKKGKDDPYDDTARPSYWALITKNIIGRGTSYDAQRTFLAEKKYSPPTKLELLIASFMTYFTTQKFLFGSEPKTY